MPIYACTSPAGTLDREHKERLADEITRIHCERTGGSPRYEVRGGVGVS